MTPPTRQQDINLAVSELPAPENLGTQLISRFFSKHWKFLALNLHTSTPMVNSALILSISQDEPLCITQVSGGYHISITSVLCRYQPKCARHRRPSSSSQYKVVSSRSSELEYKYIFMYVYFGYKSDSESDIYQSLSEVAVAKAGARSYPQRLSLNLGEEHRDQDC
jgi:hypothetical protein